MSSSLYKDSIHHASGAEWAGVAGAVPCVSGVYERGKGGLRGDEEG